MLSSDLRNAEIENFSSDLDMNKSDNSKCWKVLKDIICRNSRARKKITFTSVNGNISDSFVIANEFNNGFVSIGDKLIRKITSNTYLLSHVNNISCGMVMLEVSPNEVSQIIQTLKTLVQVGMTYQHNK